MTKPHCTQGPPVRRDPEENPKTRQTPNPKTLEPCPARRDRLYGEILKKKKEMQRLIKEKEAAWAAQQMRQNAAEAGRERRSLDHQPGQQMQAQARGGRSRSSMGSGAAPG